MKSKFHYWTISLVVGLFAIYSCTNKQSAEDTSEEVTDNIEEVVGQNQLSAIEMEEGWQMLFDGESSNGWRMYNDSIFPSGWKIVDGTLFCAGSGRGEAGAADGGDILYDKKFSNFHVKLEWKISEGGNSGIFYLGQELPELSNIWKTAPEMQILDDENHPDAKAGKDGNRKSGSLYDLIPANPQNAKPVGEWNSAEIKVYKGSVWHMQNGEVVVEYHLWTPEWEEMVAESKFPELNPDWVNVATEGYFGIQDHGDDVWFRNIKIKEL